MLLRLLFFVLAAATACLAGWQIREAKRLHKEADWLDLQALTAPLEGLTFPRDPARESAAQARANSLKEQAQTERHLAGSTELLGDAVLLPAVVFLVLGIIARPIPRAGRPGEETPDVFISYNHKNLDEARAVRDDLQATGLKAVLIDQILDVSDDNTLKDILRSQILATRALVVVLTPQSLRSDWVGFERTLGDTHLRTIIYLYRGVSFWAALWRTHFLPRSESFRVHSSLTARRRYVRYEPGGGDWRTLVCGHVARSQPRGARRLVLGQILMSYGSLDQMATNALFNTVENNTILKPRSVYWGSMLVLCKAGQLGGLFSVPLVLWGLGLILMVMFL
jgi:hypothetical protein